jgi:transcriptional regulator with GAF, ATPase, and Fis domain
VPVLTVLGHADPARVGCRALVRGDLLLGRVAPEFRRPSELSGEPLADPHLSRSPVRLTASEGGVEIDCGESPMALLADGRPETHLHVDPERLKRGVVLCLAKRVTLLLHLARVRPPPSGADEGLLGVSDALLELRSEVRRVARTDVPVLVLGESGVGKELVARAIHALSLRAQAPFEPVNMAAIPAGVAASELFGHERGAFTGADRAQPGCFGRADGGSLFLDEIGDTQLDVQPLLLRALQSGEIHPVGAQRSKRVDVRLIAATDVELDRAVEQGEFRTALLHRLAGYRLRVPPLRERREDLGVLLYHFVRGELELLGLAHRLDTVTWERPWLSAAAVDVLARHDWPGNVRELRNIARQLVISCQDAEYVGERQASQALGQASAPRDAPPASPAPTAAAARSRASEPGPRYRDPSDVSEEELVVVVRRHGFSLEPAAKALRISKTSLYALVERSGRIRKASDLTRAEIDSALAAAGGRVPAAAAALGVSVHALKLRLKTLGE